MNYYLVLKYLYIKKEAEQISPFYTELIENNISNQIEKDKNILDKEQIELFDFRKKMLLHDIEEVKRVINYLDLIPYKRG